MDFQKRYSTMISKDCILPLSNHVARKKKIGRPIFFVSVNESLSIDGWAVKLSKCRKGWSYDPRLLEIIIYGIYHSAGGFTFTENYNDNLITSHPFTYMLSFSSFHTRVI